MSTRLLSVLAWLVLIGIGGAWWAHHQTQQHSITIAAGSRHSEAYAIAKAIATVTQRYYPEIRFEVLETQGSSQNMRLIERGLAELATVQADTKSAPSARLVASLFPEMYQLVVNAELNIDHFAKLKGKRIAIPPEGSGQWKSFWSVAKHYGVESDEVEASPMYEIAANWAMLDGAVDAVFRVRAPGNAAVKELLESKRFRLVPIEQAAAMQLDQPALEHGTIAKGTYHGEPPVPAQDLATVGVQRLLVANDALDDRIAAAITAVLFERRRDLLALDPLTGFIAPPDRGKGTFIPVHPGADQFYNRDQPSFLKEQAELIALFMSLAAVFFSAIFQMRSRFKKQRINSHTAECLDIGARAQDSTSLEELKSFRARLLDLVGIVVKDAEQGRISSEGFEYFAFTWETVRDTIDERETQIEQGRVAASDDISVSTTRATGNDD